MSKEPKDPPKDPVKEEKIEADNATALSGLFANLDSPEMRNMALFGEIDEERASELCIAFLLLSQKPKPDEELTPIEFYISTYGGNADDMFAVYDIMNVAKRNCEIHTFGIGKVMSAGVLLLSNGTPGKRKIGKHCRIMIHSCNAGSVGDIHNLKNEMEAIQHQQDQYINALVEASSMTKRKLNSLLNKKVNVYLTAEQAIKYGIADEII